MTARLMYRRQPGGSWLRVLNPIYLVCVALVAAVTTSVFFGIGLYSLVHSHRTSASGTNSASELSAERGGIPRRGEPPAAVAASPGGLVTMNESSAPIYLTAQPGVIGSRPGPAVQPDATAQTLGVAAKQGGEPDEERRDSQSKPKRFAMASTEFVSGAVTNGPESKSPVLHAAPHGRGAKAGNIADKLNRAELSRLVQRSRGLR
jgi:hypothetical protein